MAYYNVCPDCGCSLDPGERCECREIEIREHENRKAFFNNWLMMDKQSGQMTFILEPQRGGTAGA